MRHFLNLWKRVIWTILTFRSPLPTAVFLFFMLPIVLGSAPIVERSLISLGLFLLLTFCMTLHILGNELEAQIEREKHGETEECDETNDPA